MSANRVREIEVYFQQLPSEKTRKYEVSIAKLAEKCTKQDDIDSLYTIIQNKGKNAYEAFFCLLTIYRRNKDFDLMKKLFDEHPEFKKRLSYNHLLVQYMVHSESFYDYNELLIIAYRDAQIFDQNSGYLQSFCNAFVTICECCDEADRENFIDEWYDIAYNCICQAMELEENYAKYFCTKGRIVCLKGKYNEAISLINQAISKENSARPDYALTILSYQMHKMNVLLKQQQSEYQKKLAHIENQFRDFMANYNSTVTSQHVSHSLPISQSDVSVYQGNGPYCFVSYAHKDSDEVYPIIAQLQDRGIPIWYDKGLRIGGEWTEEIANRIMDSTVVLVMLSTNSVQSANVRREVNMALSEDKPMVVVRMDDVELSPGMKLQFGIYQMIAKYQYSDQTFIETLFNALNNFFKD